MDGRVSELGHDLKGKWDVEWGVCLEKLWGILVWVWVVVTSLHLRLCVLKHE